MKNIINENNVSSNINNIFVDVFIVLKNNGYEKISVDELISIIEGNYVLDGISLDNNVVIEKIKNNKNIDKIEPDAENNNILTIFFKNSKENYYQSKENIEKSKSIVKKAAERTINKKFF